MNINIENYLNIDPFSIILVLISTLLLVFIAKKYFWNVITDYLKKREDFIQNELNESQKKHEESIELKKQYEEQLKNVKQEAREIIETAKVNAQLEGHEIVAKAKNEAAATKLKAQKEIEQEKIQAEKELKKEISEVAFLAASKIVEKELDEDSQKKFIQDFIEQSGKE